MVSWWQRIGSTDASGITKLVMSEANNFPEVVQFYDQEVIRPGHELFQRILQRGIDSGEFVVFQHRTSGAQFGQCDCVCDHVETCLGLQRFTQQPRSRDFFAKPC
jgi:hypothetical protein